ncbi:glucosyl-3-phosphoglycerate synthase [Corynebacterium hindlerae]|uniref:glucosyl-3-phosphoglycerate synthase n=1 Tax=Corynebacterium hindlerae TaxID=699041 RepID=UPI0031B6E660
MNELLARTSVVIPALNEEATVGEVVASVRADDPCEVLVIDSDSTDRTAHVAAQAGATVLNWRDILPEIPPVPGKGEALWRGVAAARGEFIAFVDADLIQPRAHLVRDLVQPFANPEIQLVKAGYERGFHGARTGGGRVTELAAKPLLRQLFPELAGIAQPLSGEYAIRRDIARQLPFTAGYGVEVGILLDVARRCGVAAIAQVDLGARHHRNRPLAELAPMADVVVATVLSRVSGLREGVLTPAQCPEQRPPLATL